MKKHRGVERRRDHRFGFIRELRYRVIGPDATSNTFRRARVVDVSRRGLQVLADEPVPPGSKLEVYVLAQDGQPSVSGVVEVLRCVTRPHTKTVFNQYYNPEVMVEYELGLRSAGSVLFDRLVDIT